MKFWLVLASLVGTFLGAVSVAADDPLSRIGQRLTRAPMICAGFTQTKTLRVLTRPLVSRGRMVFVADKGVLWKVRTPFPSRVLVKNDSLISWDDNGKPQRLGFEKNPIFRSLSRVVLAVLSGETEQLRQSFAIETTDTPSNWRLTLTPLDKGFAAVIARIQASGDRFVEALRIEEGRGDHTVIAFSDMNSDTCELDSAEQNDFSN